MVIKVLNLDKCLKQLKDIRDINVMNVISDGARKVQARAKDLAPVDTGALKGSIRVKQYAQFLSAVVYTNLEYAPYQEFGTVYVPAHPFMHPAFNQLKSEIERDIKEYINKEIRKRS